MSQVSLLHSSTRTNTHSHTRTPAVSLPHLGPPDTLRHTRTVMDTLAVHRTDTHSNFYPAIIKFMQSDTGHVCFSPVLPVGLKKYPSKWFSPTFFFQSFNISPSRSNKMIYLTEFKKKKKISLLSVCDFVTFFKALLRLCKHDSFCIQGSAHPSTLSQVFSARCF